MDIASAWAQSHSCVLLLGCCILLQGSLRHCNRLSYVCVCVCACACVWVGRSFHQLSEGLKILGGSCQFYFEIIDSYSYKKNKTKPKTPKNKIHKPTNTHIYMKKKPWLQSINLWKCFTLIRSAFVLSISLLTRLSPCCFSKVLMNNTTKFLSFLLPPFFFIFLLLQRSTDTVQRRQQKLSQRQCCLHCSESRALTLKTLDCKGRLHNLFMWKEVSSNCKVFKKQFSLHFLKKIFSWKHSTETALIKVLDVFFFF